MSRLLFSWDRAPGRCCGRGDSIGQFLPSQCPKPLGISPSGLGGPSFRDVRAASAFSTSGSYLLPSSLRLSFQLLGSLLSPACSVPARLFRVSPSTRESMRADACARKALFHKSASRSKKDSDRRSPPVCTADNADRGDALPALVEALGQRPTLAPVNATRRPGGRAPTMLPLAPGPPAIRARRAVGGERRRGHGAAGVGHAGSVAGGPVQAWCAAGSHASLLVLTVPSFAFRLPRRPRRRCQQRAEAPPARRRPGSACTSTGS